MMLIFSAALIPANEAEKPRWLREREDKVMAGIAGGSSGGGGEDGKKVPAWLQQKK